MQPNQTVTTTQTSKFVRDQKVLITVGIILFVLLILGVIIILSLGNRTNTNTNATGTSSVTTQNTQDSMNTSSATSSTSAPSLMWSQSADGGWISLGNPPNCPDPLEIPAPSGLDTATALLYPGQTRGGNYKPHGGIAYDNNPDNKITVSLPMDARLFRGSRYIEQGELQYLLDFITPCGIMFRYDHLKVLSPEFQALVDADLPQPQVDDTRTIHFANYPSFAANTTVAIEVGHTGNVAFDWGVYDLRQPNQASQDSAWAAVHANFKETTFYAICWIENLPTAQKSIAMSLPARGSEGKTSDYCN